MDTCEALIRKREEELRTNNFALTPNLLEREQAELLHQSRRHLGQHLGSCWRKSESYFQNPAEILCYHRDSFVVGFLERLYLEKF